MRRDASASKVIMKKAKKKGKSKSGNDVKKVIPDYMQAGEYFIC